MQSQPGRLAKLTHRFIALGIALCFFANTAAYGSLPLEVHVEPLPQIQIPANLGVIETQSLNYSADRPFLIHIQDAHGNPSGQRNTAKIIQYLFQNYGIKTVFVEGAVEELNFRYLDFFKDQSFNQKLIEKLVDEGEITGSELALNTKGLHAIGIEDAGLYRKNFELFRDVMHHEAQSNVMLEKMRRELERKASRELNKDALVLLRDYLSFDRKNTNWIAVTGELNRLSKEYLHRDFAAAKEQIEFPNLVRLFQLKAEEGQIDVSKSETEEKAIAETFGSFGSLTEGNPRHTIEKLYQSASRRGFKFENYPNFTRYARNRIFQYEIESASLFDEISQVLDLLISAMIPEDFARQIRNFRLLRGLQSLELTREEWGKLKSTRPEASSAVSFYETAEAREMVFMKKIEGRLRESKNSRAVLITGGFHTEGLRQYFNDHQISYLTIRPQIDGDSSKIYRQSMTRGVKTSGLVLAQLAQSRASLESSLGSEALNARLAVVSAGAASLGEVAQAKAKFEIPSDPKQFLDALDLGGLKQLFEDAQKAMAYSADVRPLDWENKPGALLNIETGKKLVVLGDLQGHFYHLTSLLHEPGVLAGLEDGSLHLVFLGDLMHPSGDLMYSADAQLQTLATLALFMKLKTEFPKNVHAVLGNHDLSHIMDSKSKAGKFFRGTKILQHQTLEFNSYILQEYGYGEFGGAAVLIALSNFLKSWPIVIRARVGDQYIMLIHARPASKKNSQKKLVNLLKKGYNPKDNSALNIFLFSRKFDGNILAAYFSRIGLAALFSGHTPPKSDLAKKYGFLGMRDKRFAAFGANLILDAQERPDFGYALIDMTHNLPRHKNGNVALELMKDPDGKSAFHVVAVEKKNALAKSMGDNTADKSQQVSQLTRADQLLIVGMTFHELSGWVNPILTDFGTIVTRLPLERLISPEKEKDIRRLYSTSSNLVHRLHYDLGREEIEPNPNITSDDFFIKIWRILLKLSLIVRFMNETHENAFRVSELTSFELLILERVKAVVLLGESLDELMDLIRRSRSTNEVNSNFADVRKIVQITQHLYLKKESMSVQAGKNPADKFDVAVTLPEAALPVRVSKLGMVFILGNLIRNAKKHSATEVQIEAVYDSRYDKVVLFVRNNGTPISSETIPLLFKKGKSDDKSRPEAGLGLNLSKRLIESYGGEMILLTSGGQAPTFKIEFPFARASAPSLGASQLSGTAVALGGNAMIAEDGPLKDNRSQEAQAQNMKAMLENVLKLYHPGQPLLITHGNGPQVGDLWLFYEGLLKKRQIHEVPRLSDLVGMTQRQIFNDYIHAAYLQIKHDQLHDLPEIFMNRTRVVVDPNDSAFRHPDKPIGPYYLAHQAQELEREKGWVFTHVPGKGYRRVVASPKPLSIFPGDLEEIRKELSSGKIVVAVGGGGIPVRFREGDAVEELEGVIDKDRSSALLAKELNLKNLLIVTGVPRVKVHFKQPTEKELIRPSVAELTEYYQHGEFPPGSMGPKVEAMLAFVSNGNGRCGIITDAEHIEKVFEPGSDAGTVVTTAPAMGASLGESEDGITRRDLFVMALVAGAFAFCSFPKTLTQESSPKYRFAPEFKTEDLISKKESADAYLRKFLYWEGQFHQPGIAYNAGSGLTYDGHSIDFETGELRGAPRNWSAASKESLQVALLALAVDGSDERAKLFMSPDDPSKAEAHALDILTRKITSYEKFGREYPGFGGFLPWFLVSNSGMQPTHDWQDRVPALDNGQLAWSLYTAYHALEAKGQKELAARYKAQFDVMAQNAVTIFYESDGKIRGEVKIKNVKAAPSRENYSNNTTFLADPYEGELFTFFITLFGRWNNTEEADKVWANQRPNLKPVDFKTPQGRLTTLKGFWFSSHELWKYLILPYTDDPTVRQIFENGEKARTWNSALNKIPGLFASSHDVVNGNQNPAYLAESGIPELAFQPVKNKKVIAPYAAFPVMLAGPSGIALAWLDVMLKGPRMQSRFGSVESGSVDGNAVAPLLTWDGKMTTVLAALGGVHPQIAKALKADGKYDAFRQILKREYGSIFPAVEKNDIPFAVPTASISQNISDFKTSGKSLGSDETILPPGKIKLQVMADKEKLPEEVADRFLQAVNRKPDGVFGLATGGTMESVYDVIVERFRRDSAIDFSRAVTFNLDEYVGLSPEHVQSYRYYMETHLFERLREIDPARAFKRENTHLFNGRAANSTKEISEYLSKIRKKGGIDWQLLGIGKDGHFAFVEPAREISDLTLRDFNEFTVGSDIHESELGQAISRAMAERVKIRSNLGSDSHLVDELAAYRPTADRGDLTAELDILGRRMLEHQETIFYIPNLNPEKAETILVQIPAEYRKNLILKDVSEFFEPGAKRVSLALPTILDNSRYFTNINLVPLKALTLAGEVRRAREIVLAANGEKKAEAIHDSLANPVSPAVTSSVFQGHDNATFIVDAAASVLIPEKIRHQAEAQAKAASLGKDFKGSLSDVQRLRSITHFVKSDKPFIPALWCEDKKTIAEPSAITRIPAELEKQVRKILEHDSGEKKPRKQNAAFQDAVLDFILAEDGLAFLKALTFASHSPVTLNDIQEVQVFLELRDLEKWSQLRIGENLATVSLQVALTHGRKIRLTLVVDLKTKPLRNIQPILTDGDQKTAGITSNRLVDNQNNLFFLSQPFVLDDGALARYLYSRELRLVKRVVVKGYARSRYSELETATKRVERARAQLLTRLFWNPFDQNLTEGERILDIGVGQGRDLLYLDDKTREMIPLPDSLVRKLSVTDYMTGPLKEIQSRYPSIETIVGDWRKIPKPEHTFKHIIGFDALGYMPMAEMDDVLRELGRLIISASSGTEVMTFVEDVMPYPTRVYSGPDYPEWEKLSAREKERRMAGFVEEWKKLIADKFRKHGYEVKIEQVTETFIGPHQSIHDRPNHENVFATQFDGVFGINFDSSVPAGLVREQMEALVIHVYKEKTAVSGTAAESSNYQTVIAQPEESRRVRKETIRLTREIVFELLPNRAPPVLKEKIYQAAKSREGFSSVSELEAFVREQYDQQSKPATSESTNNLSSNGASLGREADTAVYQLIQSQSVLIPVPEKRPVDENEIRHWDVRIGTLHRKISEARLSAFRRGQLTVVDHMTRILDMLGYLIYVLHGPRPHSTEDLDWSRMQIQIEAELRKELEGLRIAVRQLPLTSETFPRVLAQNEKPGMSNEEKLEWVKKELEQIDFKDSYSGRKVIVHLNADRDIPFQVVSEMVRSYSDGHTTRSKPSEKQWYESSSSFYGWHDGEVHRTFEFHIYINHGVHAGEFLEFLLKPPYASDWETIMRCFADRQFPKGKEIYAALVAHLEWWKYEPKIPENFQERMPEDLYQRLEKCPFIQKTLWLYITHGFYQAKKFFDLNQHEIDSEIALLPACPSPEKVNGNFSVAIYYGWINNLASEFFKIKDVKKGFGSSLVVLTQNLFRYWGDIWFEQYGWNSSIRFIAYPHELDEWKRREATRTGVQGSITGASLGDHQIVIPGAAWVPVELVKNYAGAEQVDRDFKAGFFKWDDRGQIWAPVLRDPLYLPSDYFDKRFGFHKRSLYEHLSDEDVAKGIPTRVVKGAGEAYHDVIFSYRPSARLNTQKFRGGETKDIADYAAGIAKQIRNEYEKALQEKDPVVMLAKEKYGIDSAPTLRPLYLLRPKRIPEKELLKWGYKLKDAKKELRRGGFIPEEYIENQVVFVYEVPLMSRVYETKILEKELITKLLLSPLLAFSGSSATPESVMKQFAARLAVVRHLMERRLRGTFSVDVDFPNNFNLTIPLDQRSIVSSLSSNNVTLTGHVVDLDSATVFMKKRKLPVGRLMDEFSQKGTFAFMESFLGASNWADPEIGRKVFDEVYQAGEAKPVMTTAGQGPAEGLGAGSSLGSKPNWVPVDYDPKFIEAMMKLSHPSIPRFRKNDQSGNYEIRWVEGKRWSEWLEETGKMSEEDFLKQIVLWTIQLGEALKLMHDAGFIHGDLSEENIVIEAGTNNPVLIDLDDASYDSFSGDLSLLKFLIPGSIHFRKEFFRPQEHILDRGLFTILRSENSTLGQFVSQLKQYFGQRWPAAAGQTPLVQDVNPVPSPELSGENSTLVPDSIDLSKHCAPQEKIEQIVIISDNSGTLTNNEAAPVQGEILEGLKHFLGKEGNFLVVNSGDPLADFLGKSQKPVIESLTGSDQRGRYFAITDGGANRVLLEPDGNTRLKRLEQDEPIATRIDFARKLTRVFYGELKKRRGKFQKFLNTVSDEDINASRREVLSRLDALERQGTWGQRAAGESFYRFDLLSKDFLKEYGLLLGEVFVYDVGPKVTLRIMRAPPGVYSADFFHSLASSIEYALFEDYPGLKIAFGASKQDGFIDLTHYTKAGAVNKTMHWDILPRLDPNKKTVILIIGDGGNDISTLRLTFRKQPNFIMVPIFLNRDSAYAPLLPGNTWVGSDKLEGALQVIRFANEIKGKPAGETPRLLVSKWQNRSSGRETHAGGTAAGGQGSAEGSVAGASIGKGDEQSASSVLQVFEGIDQLIREWEAGRVLVNSIDRNWYRDQKFHAEEGLLLMMLSELDMAIRFLDPTGPGAFNYIDTFNFIGSVLSARKNDLNDFVRWVESQNPQDQRKFEKELSFSKRILELLAAQIIFIDRIIEKNRWSGDVVSLSKDISLQFAYDRLQKEKGGFQSVRIQFGGKDTESNQIVINNELLHWRFTGKSFLEEDGTINLELVTKGENKGKCNYSVMYRVKEVVKGKYKVSLAVNTETANPFTVYTEETVEGGKKAGGLQKFREQRNYRVVLESKTTRKRIEWKFPQVLCDFHIEKNNKGIDLEFQIPHSTYSTYESYDKDLNLVERQILGDPPQDESTGASLGEKGWDPLNQLPTLISMIQALEQKPAKLLFQREVPSKFGKVRIVAKIVPGYHFVSEMSESMPRYVLKSLASGYRPHEGILLIQYFQNKQAPANGPPIPDGFFLGNIEGDLLKDVEFILAPEIRGHGILRETFKELNTSLPAEVTRFEAEIVNWETLASLALEAARKIPDWARMFSISSALAEGAHWVIDFALLQLLEAGKAHPDFNPQLFPSTFIAKTLLGRLFLRAGFKNFRIGFRPLTERDRKMEARGLALPHILIMGERQISRHAHGASLGAEVKSGEKLSGELFRAHVEYSKEELEWQLSYPDWPDPKFYERAKPLQDIVLIMFQKALEQKGREKVLADLEALRKWKSFVLYGHLSEILRHAFGNSVDSYLRRVRTSHAEDPFVFEERLSQDADKNFVIDFIDNGMGEVDNIQTQEKRKASRKYWGKEGVGNQQLEAQVMLLHLDERDGAHTHFISNPLATTRLFNRSDRPGAIREIKIAPDLILQHFDMAVHDLRILTKLMEKQEDDSRPAGASLGESPREDADFSRMFQSWRAIRDFIDGGEMKKVIEESWGISLNDQELNDLTVSLVHIVPSPLLIVRNQLDIWYRNSSFLPSQEEADRLRELFRESKEELEMFLSSQDEFLPSHGKSHKKSDTLSGFIKKALRERGMAPEKIPAYGSEPFNRAAAQIRESVLSHIVEIEQASEVLIQKLKDRENASPEAQEANSELFQKGFTGSNEIFRKEFTYDQNQIKDLLTKRYGSQDELKEIQRMVATEMVRKIFEKFPTQTKPDFSEEKLKDVQLINDLEMLFCLSVDNSIDAYIPKKENGFNDPLRLIYRVVQENGEFVIQLIDNGEGDVSNRKTERKRSSVGGFGWASTLMNQRVAIMGAKTRLLERRDEQGAIREIRIPFSLIEDQLQQIRSGLHVPQNPISGASLGMTESGRLPNYAFAKMWEDGNEHAFDGKIPTEINQFWLTFFRDANRSNPRARILDFATGNMIVPRLARKASKQFEVHGVDIVEPTLKKEISDSKLQFHLLYPGEFPSEKPFAPQSFDVVTSMYGVEYANIEQALKWLSGLLVPGGRAAFIIHHRDSVIVKVARAQLSARYFINHSQILKKWRTAIDETNPETLAALQQSVDLMKKEADKFKYLKTPWDEEALFELAEVVEVVTKWIKIAYEYPRDHVRLRLDQYEKLNDVGTKIKELLVSQAAIYGTGDEEKLRTLFANNGFYIQHLSVVKSDGNVLGWKVELQKEIASQASDTITHGSSLGAENIADNLEKIKKLCSDFKDILREGGELDEFLGKNLDVNVPEEKAMKETVQRIFSHYGFTANNIILGYLDLMGEEPEPAFIKKNLPAFRRSVQDLKSILEDWNLLKEKKHFSNYKFAIDRALHDKPVLSHDQFEQYFWSRSDKIAAEVKKMFYPKVLLLEKAFDDLAASTGASLGEEALASEITNRVNQRGNPKIPFIVGIAGGSSIGKTTLAGNLKMRLEIQGNKVCVLGFDEFLKALEEGKSVRVHWNYQEVDIAEMRKVLLAIRNGEKRIETQFFNRATGKRSPAIIDLNGVDTVIFEGLYSISNDPKLGNLLELVDLPIYFDGDEAMRYQWRYEREMKQPRPRTPEEWKTFWDLGVVPDYFQHVKPSKANAKIILHALTNHEFTIEKVADGRGKSLGAAGADGKLNIPAATWVAVRLLKNYGGKDQIARDIESKFLIPTREKDVYLAPVLRDPSIKHYPTIHKRAIYSIPTAEEFNDKKTTRVIKGAGLEQPHRQRLFAYSPDQYFNTQRFRGGDQDVFSRHAADVAKKIHEEYQKALAEKDSAVMIAKREFGITEAPVLKPLYLFRPLEIPVKKGKGLIHENPRVALKQAGVPERVIRNQAIFVYEVPLNTRLYEIGYIEDLVNDHDPHLGEKILNFYGKYDKEEMLKRFAARLALANHLMHRRLHGTFSVETTRPDLPFPSSLNQYNVTIAGYLTDLDTASLNITREQALRCMTNDHGDAIRAILQLAQYLDISPKVGLGAYFRVWRKNTRPEDLLSYTEIRDELPLAVTKTISKPNPVNLSYLLAVTNAQQEQKKGRKLLSMAKSLGDSAKVSDRADEAIIDVAHKVTKDIFAKEDVALLGDVLDVMLGVGAAHANVSVPQMIAPGISVDQLTQHLIRKIVPQTLPDGPVAVVLTGSVKPDYIEALKNVIREGDLILEVGDSAILNKILPLLHSIAREKHVIVKSLATDSPLAAELEMKLKGYSKRISLEALNDSVLVPSTKKDLTHFSLNQKLLSEHRIAPQVVDSLLRRLAQIQDYRIREQVFEQAGLKRIDDMHWVVGEGLVKLIEKLQAELAGHKMMAQAA